MANEGEGPHRDGCRGRAWQPTTPARSKAKNPLILRIFKSNVYVRDHDRSLRFYLRISSVSAWWPTATRIRSLGRDCAPGRQRNFSAPRSPSRRGKLSPHRAAHQRRLHRRGHPRGLRAVAQPRCEIQPPPQTQLWGGTFATFVDPDGNSFELLGSDEMSREIEAQRRAASERVESERRTAQELEIAKQVQAQLSPQTSPKLRTLDYAGVCIQARHVGGDYYDFLSFRPVRFGLVLGGHFRQRHCGRAADGESAGEFSEPACTCGNCPGRFCAP